MQIHQLKRIHKNKKAKEVGRGGKHAKTSGRGTKGQNARAGRKKRPELRDIIKKLPKNRGYNAPSSRYFPTTISLSSLQGKFKSGDLISPKVLLEKKIISTKKGRVPDVKLLGGEISFSAEFSSILVSKSAKEAIEKAGGKVVEWKKVVQEVEAPKKEAPKKVSKKK